MMQTARSETLADNNLDANAISVNARRLAPAIAARSAEIEALRRLPSDLVRDLREAGIFRMAMPRWRGGPQMSLREQVEVIEILSHADPSVGWCTMIWIDNGLFSTWLGDAGTELFPSLDTICAGNASPIGRADRVEGGYVVSGRWPFGSGVQHADVLCAGCIVHENGAPVPSRDNPALPFEFRIMFAPASGFVIEDSWHTTGLAGSGSTHYAAEHLFVAEAHSFSLFDPPSERLMREPLYAFRGNYWDTGAGVPLGLARRAIDEALAIAETKLDLFTQRPLRELPRVQLAIAEAEMAYGAARAFLHESLDRFWAELEAGVSSITLPTRTARVLSHVNAYRMAHRVSDAMFRLAGSAALYKPAPLDRLMRDAATINLHMAISDAALETYGTMALGSPHPVSAIW